MFPRLNKNKVNQVGISAITVVLSAISINAHATLTNYNVNNTELVYSSVSDVTWTKDANLLGTLISNSTDKDGNGVKDVIEAIVAVGVANSLTVGFSSFNDNGLTTWLGALAYVNYLNSVNYGGSSKWYIPTVVYNTFGTTFNINGADKGEELRELFYSEQIGTAVNGFLNTTIFDNEQNYAYWTGTEYSSNSMNVWGFFTPSRLQYEFSKSDQLFTWAVTPGQISAVPEPESVAMLLAGLVLVGGVVRRRQKLA